MLGDYSDIIDELAVTHANDATYVQRAKIVTRIHVQIYVCISLSLSLSPSEHR